MSNTAAADAYAAAHAEAMGLAEQILEKVTDMDAPGEHTDWGHVGDVARLVVQLRQILDPQ